MVAAETTTQNTKAFAKRVKKSFIYSGIGNILGRLVALVGIVIGITMLTPAQWGAATFALAVLNIVRAFTEAGLGVALIQMQTASRKQMSSLFWLSLIITVGTYLFIFFVVAPLLGYFWPNITDAKNLVRGICFAVALYTFYFIPRALMERDLEFGRLTFVDNFSLIFGTVLLFWSAQRGDGAWAFIYFEVGTRGCQALLSTLARPFRPALHFAFSEIRQMFHFAIYATGSRLLYNLYSNVDFFVVGKFFGETTLGIYSTAWRIIAEPVNALQSIISQVAYPVFARLQYDITRLRLYFFSINRIAIACTASLLGFIIVFTKPGLVAFKNMPPEYINVIPLIYVLAIMGIFRTIAPLMPQLLNATGKSRQSFFYTLISAIILPIAFTIGANFGLIGVAWAWAIAYPLLTLILFYFVAQTLGIELSAIFKLFQGLKVVLLTLSFCLLVLYFCNNIFALPVIITSTIGAGVAFLGTIAICFITQKKTLQLLHLQ